MIFSRPLSWKDASFESPKSSGKYLIYGYFVDDWSEEKSSMEINIGHWHSSDAWLSIRGYQSEFIITYWASIYAPINILRKETR